MLKTGLLLCYDSRHAHACDFPILLAPEQAQPQTLRVGRADTDRAGNVAHQQLHGSNSVRAGNEGLRPVGSRCAAGAPLPRTLTLTAGPANGIPALATRTRTSGGRSVTPLAWRSGAEPD